MDTRSLIPLLLLTVLCCACSPLRRLPATPRSAEAATGSVNAQETAQTKAPEAGLTAVRILEQVALSIPAGQYSGITWLGGKRYAVVHDKLNGGGIVFFDIEMDLATGAIGAVSVSIPDITRLSALAGMDNEGIAFADGKLYVSAESDQSIREYGLDGAPTGRSLAVPEKLGRSNITANAGFESLTWSPATRLFWTTTEKPLRADTTGRGFHRLQSFGPDLKPAGQYLYRMDEPLRSAEATRAYVHGIAAMTALDDGRLVILEREVYVPSNLLRALGETMSVVKLYIVNPSRSGSGILPKQLLASFATTLADLANYEGMCLGPTLADGRRTLVLIADSQGGMSGFTREYLKVIVF